MLLANSERTALFIDGANLYSASRSLGFDVDYRDMLQYFRSRTNVLRAYYYSALLESDEYSPLRPLTDWLAYNGYTLVTKAAREFTDTTGRRRYKGNMDVELAVDMLELAPRLDHAVLFSGDGDFRRLVEAVQRQGVRVSVISSVRTVPPMAADELRRQADQFVELAEIATEFTRRGTETRRPPARSGTDPASSPPTKPMPAHPLPASPLPTGAPRAD
ncbi:MAG: NYN domain-containing protein [Janthinobacterium lividum]